ncbi:hypothetical protein B0J12DRAFT_293225 [Macrophomina phaseolina]|uniref:C2H2-type domain-containing protein n=1 Tax=Macrophomina phaseolina TaxID=35725 RepID=A0ABQ8GRF6_9PEZI|nr:hypothetical protein B0J12DRAFT_293225 [Macrophomina phaseolina]
MTAVLRGDATHKHREPIATWTRITGCVAHFPRSMPAPPRRMPPLRQPSACNPTPASTLPPDRLALRRASTSTLAGMLHRCRHCRKPLAARFELLVHRSSAMRVDRFAASAHYCTSVRFARTSLCYSRPVTNHLPSPVTHSARHAVSARARDSTSSFDTLFISSLDRSPAGLTVNGAPWLAVFSPGPVDDGMLHSCPSADEPH